MLLLFLLPFLLQLLGARDVPNDNSYVIKPISSCPDVGYFFRREPVPNSLGPGVCFLCFCQDNRTAICWRRENRRCDVGSYQQHLEKKDTRVRRSPLGLSDIFFRDAARDVFNKNTPPSCKPFETSFSEGCPPADWCIGCTVCDCDANGRWDCHILSFCPDKDDKTKMRTANKSLKKPKSNSGKSKYTKHPSRTTKKQAITKAVRKAVTRRPNRQVKNVRRRRINTLNATQKGSPKPLIINKDISTKKPIVFKSKPNKIKLNATDREVITQEVVKRVVTVMQRMLNKSQIINNQLLNALPSPKTIQKRSMDKKPGKNNAKKYKPASTHKKQYRKPVPQRNSRKPKSNKVKVNKKVSPNTSTNSRQKREVDINEIELNALNINTSLNDSPSNIIMDSSSDNEIFNKVENHYKYSVMTTHPGDDLNNKEPYQANADSFKNTNDGKLKTIMKTERDNETVKNSSINLLLNYSKKYVNKTIKDNIIPLKGSPLIDIGTTNNRLQVDLLKYNIFKDTSITHATQKPNGILNITTLLDDTTTTMHYFKNSEQVLKLHVKKYSNDVIKNRTIDNFKKHTNESCFKTQVFKKIDNIQNVLKRVISQFRKNRTRIVKPKAEKFNVMKYFKSFFKKIFHKNNRKRTTDHVINSICVMIRGCNKNQKFKKSLKPKVKALNIEANFILRTTKTIKGLLHLFDFHNTTQIGDAHLKDDIHKLNFVLKEEYVKTDINITENQKALIDYIKSNTQVFIQAVGRFSNILSDIITILISKTDNKILDIRNRRNINKTSLPQSNDNNFTAAKEFKRIKTLLAKYNLAQNTFMKKIYEILKKFENSPNKVSDAMMSKQNTKGHNATVAIENFSRNIIKNLKKLKNLAEVLNSKNRRKRSVIRDDDTVEYLLTLMEYLLKQNYPLDAAPVNDGIDLLIEAIKSAPDIKPIKKKVLQNIPQNRRKSRTTEVPPLQISYEESSLDSKSASSKEDNTTSSQNGSKSEAEEPSANKFREHYRYQPEYNIFEKTTELVDYGKAYSAHQRQKDIIVTTLPYSIAKNSVYDDHADILQTDIFDNENKGRRKIEMFSSDSDDEDSNMETTSPTTVPVVEDTESTTTSEAPAVTTELKLGEVRQLHDSRRDLSYGDDVVQRTTLDWLDEGYNQEGKDVKIRKSESLTSKPLIRTFTTVKKPTLQRNIDTISSITKEFSDEEDKQRLVKLNTEEVMYKKQMDLLNSLDYGTERSELEDPETKDDKDDVFLSYYN